MQAAGPALNALDDSPYFLIKLRSFIGKPDTNSPAFSMSDLSLEYLWFGAENS